MRVLAVGLLCALLYGCAYYPATVEYYDEECQILQSRLVVEKSSYGLMRQCSNEACIAVLLSIPVERLVVGSMVVAGNSVLWMEKKGRCLLK
jgi:hypothetical protein